MLNLLDVASLYAQFCISTSMFRFDGWIDSCYRHSSKIQNPDQPKTCLNDFKMHQLTLQTQPCLRKLQRMCVNCIYIYIISKVRNIQFNSLLIVMLPINYVTCPLSIFCILKQANSAILSWLHKSVSSTVEPFGCFHLYLFYFFDIHLSVQHISI